MNLKGRILYNLNEERVELYDTIKDQGTFTYDEEWNYVKQQLDDPDGTTRLIIWQIVPEWLSLEDAVELTALASEWHFQFSSLKPADALRTLKMMEENMLEESKLQFEKAFSQKMPLSGLSIARAVYYHNQATTVQAYQKLFEKALTKEAMEYQRAEEEHEWQEREWRLRLEQEGSS